MAQITAATREAQAGRRRERNRELIPAGALAAWGRQDAAALASAAADAAKVDAAGDVPAAIDARQRAVLRPGEPVPAEASRLADAWTVATAAPQWAGRDDAPLELVRTWVRLTGCECCGAWPATAEWAGTGQVICWGCVELKRAAGLG